MVDPERLAAFALMTAATSVVPGVSMLFVMGQTIRIGWRSGAAALTGLQIGYIGWWLLAAVGLGTLATAFPAAFAALAVGGALYLAWLGVKAIRHGGRAGPSIEAGKGSLHALRDGILVALGNPKSLIYIVALLPPFVDTKQSIGPQLVVMAVAALFIDVIVGAIYIAAGQGLTAAMSDPQTRRRLDIAIGLLFLAIALGILAEMALR
ncbi:Homoserine/homoserine lactone efflux protein [Tsuneonella dongtanensis]|uniref:Homoserine/homoserine lactone efflux protein n=1 Tax=Tsuneonella dongtanensis TaxID=692370 RepID=A0A1B2AEI6_9SPHN|nr:LysE family translocator [Tsuneonella dongtanensis]ANY20580.1 Homoserine/homoserine lactone efflux protein [Tsuneonella dongtanensis]